MKNIMFVIMMLAMGFVSATNIACNTLVEASMRERSNFITGNTKYDQDLTQEKADEKLTKIEKIVTEGYEHQGKPGRHIKRINIEQLKLKLEAAVANGDLTQEKADEKLTKIEKIVTETEPVSDTL